MQQQALSLILAWDRLETASAALSAHLRRELGITALQHALLRLLSERPSLPLATLRKSLLMHPATLGQAVDALRRRGLCTVARDPEDRRARIVAISPAGQAVIARAPLAGTVRLRQVRVSPQRLARLTSAFEDAIELFGLDAWAPPRREKAP